MPRENYRASVVREYLILGLKIWSFGESIKILGVGVYGSCFHIFRVVF